MSIFKIKSLGAFKRITALYQPFWPVIAITIIISLTSESLSACVPIIWSKIIGGLIHHEVIRLVFTWGVVWLILDMLDSGVDLMSAWFNINHLAFNVDKYINVKTLEKISTFSIGQIINNNSGYRQKIVSQGQGAITSTVDMFLYELMPMMARVLILWSFIMWQAPMIGVVVTACIIWFTLSTTTLNNKIVGPIKDYRKKDNKLGQEYSEIMKNMSLVLLNAREHKMLAEYGSQYDETTSFAKNIWLRYNVTSLYSRELPMKTSFFIVIITSIYCVSTGVYSALSLVMILPWCMTLFANIGRISPMQRRLAIWASSIERYFELIDMKPAILPQAKSDKVEQLDGRIEFRNVSFKYPVFKKEDHREDDEDKRETESEPKAALVDVSFTINQGETCAIVGHSGAGKSTLIHLLMRAYDPDNGSVLIDGTDLSTINLKGYRAQIGYVEQNVKLWDETLRYNMSFGLNGEAHLVTEADLHDIATESCVDKFYDRLGEKKFESFIGENGIMLSGGERQRVGIARALMKKPKILIFDEATNSLDTINDQLIQVAMKKALQGRTGIIIAHRLSTIRHADKIVVMEKGRVSAVGKHQDLLESCPIYKKMVNSESVAIVAG